METWDGGHQNALTRLFPPLVPIWNYTRDADIRIQIHALQGLYNAREGFPKYVHKLPHPSEHLDTFDPTYRGILDILSEKRYIDLRNYICSEIELSWINILHIYPTTSAIPNPFATLFLPPPSPVTPALHVIIRFDWAPNGTLELTIYTRDSETLEVDRLVTFNNYDPIGNACSYNVLPIEYRFALFLYVIPLGEYRDFLNTHCTYLRILPAYRQPLHFITFL